MKNEQVLKSITAAVPVGIEAAEGDGGLPRFTMVGYTGAAMRVGGWYRPLVVDLSGMRIPSQTLPIRLQHDAYHGVGHTDRITIEGGRLTATGLISRDTESARDVVKSSRKGFPWQASIGASVDEYEQVKEGEKVTVNGQEHAGPLVVVRKSTLGEISFVDCGADGNTSASVTANFVEVPMEEIQGGGSGNNTTPPIRANVTPEVRSASGERSTTDVLAAARRERERLEAIRALVEEAVSVRGADIATIERIAREAEEGGWDKTRTELAILRETRPKPINAAAKKDQPTQAVLEAALLMSCGVSDEKIAKDRDYGERVAAAAWPMRSRGLRGTLTAALEASGTRVPHGADELYTAMIQHHVQASGFSTLSLPGIIGNVANKMLLDAFTSVQATYDMIAQQADFANFHTHSIYRLDHMGDYSKVGADGQLKHGNLAESTYSNKLDTYGQMLQLPRQAIINDDLNAFVSLITTLARKGRLAVEKALYALVMESANSFYTSQRGNLNTGAALSITSLGVAEAGLMNQKDANGDPIYAMARYLLVPPALKFLADSIFTSAVLNETTTADKGRPSDNPFRGRFGVVSSPYLQLAALGGSSATTWYLLADPNVLPAFQVAYLNGRRAPVVETADTTFNSLGLQMRSYWDFGVARIDYRGAQKNTA